VAGHLDNVDSTIAAADLEGSRTARRSADVSRTGPKRRLVARTTIFSWSISRLIGPLSLVASSGRQAQAPLRTEGLSVVGVAASPGADACAFRPPAVADRGPVDALGDASRSGSGSGSGT
jgi:hypothetical protein